MMSRKEYSSVLVALPPTDMDTVAIITPTRRTPTTTTAVTTRATKATKMTTMMVNTMIKELPDSNTTKDNVQNAVVMTLKRTLRHSVTSR